MSERKTLSAERIKELQNRPIDLSDIPEVSDSMWESGHYRNWKPAKKAISLRIDLDNYEWLKTRGPGYQKRLNEVLRWARSNGCPIA